MFRATLMWRAYTGHCMDSRSPSQGLAIKPDWHPGNRQRMNFCAKKVPRNRITLCKEMKHTFINFNKDMKLKWKKMRSKEIKMRWH